MVEREVYDIKPSIAVIVTRREQCSNRNIGYYDNARDRAEADTSKRNFDDDRKPLVAYIHSRGRPHTLTTWSVSSGSWKFK